MFDVFYFGNFAPGLFPHERRVDSIEQAQQLSRTRYFWIINYLVDYTGFDFLWEPPPWQQHQRHAWPSQWQKDSETYLCPVQGWEDTNYHLSPQLTRTPDLQYWTNVRDGFDYSWHPDPSEPDMTYQFGTQWQKTGGPTYSRKGSTKIKYVAQPRWKKDTVDDCWEMGQGEFDEFDWTWHPDETDPPYIYQFGTQHQRTGGPRYQVPGARDIKFIDQIKIKTQRIASGVVLIDHLDGNDANITGIDIIKKSRYFDNYLDTLRRIASSLPDDIEFVWIASSLCDYKNFDWSWHPELWQAGMLHVFASDDQKFGDTFFMHVPSFRIRSATCQLLEWYDVNFVSESVPRHAPPIISHEFDSHVPAVKKYKFDGPLAIFVSNKSNPRKWPTINLWRNKTKTIAPLSKGGSSVIVPKLSVPVIKQQLYDYPEIDKKYTMYGHDSSLDIVFISNGETNAERNWEWLNETCRAKMVPNRIVRVDGVNGRAAAYKAALEASNTDWAFCVFAKLQIEPTFDWSWQPDRLQSAKHYIFHARNPVNGLVYGHMAMIAYNKRLTLENEALGLDFTLDQAHEVVPVLSGVAWYADSPWMAWRTAFREALKLRHSLPDVENEYRLGQWLKENNNDDYAKWSHLGAQDAVEYYNEVDGDFAALKKSYEWSWLASYAMLKRNLLPDR